MAAPLSYHSYRAARAREWLTLVGDPRLPPILIVPPLFEEMNRTRALLLALMRALAAEGHGCWLPDLTGTGESEVALEEARWNDWLTDVKAASDHVAEETGKAVAVAAVRGGCLIDTAAQARCHWRFAPVAGASLARELDRAGLAGGAEWAGYPASPTLRQSLADASPAVPATPLRTVRLGTDVAAADHKVDGPALWRRSEPGRSDALAAALAADLNDWARSCAGS